MSEEGAYKNVYTGPETNVQYLQELFTDEGIESRVRNEFEAGLRAGFGGGLPGQVQLFVTKDRYQEALKIAKSTFPKDYKDE